MIIDDPLQKLTEIVPDIRIGAKIIVLAFANDIATFSEILEDVTTPP